jgi:hypothetical protein
LTIATGVLRDALVGYREMVGRNFPNFGAALGLHSVLPVRVDGLVARFDSDTQRSQVEMVVELVQDPSLGTRSIPPVNLQLVTDRRHLPRWHVSWTRAVLSPAGGPGTAGSGDPDGLGKRGSSLVIIISAYR